MANKIAPVATVSLATARAHWHRIQGLDARDPDVVTTLARTGYVRTLGGADVYLALAARVADLTRASLEAATEAGDVHVIPAVRGCIYFVPGADVPLALRYAETQWRPRNDRDLGKVGCSQQEIDDVGAAVVEALADGAKKPHALRKALPDGVVRSFGDVGKKIGLSSNLPVALRHLEFAGVVERELEGGRLDSERYAWRLAATNPFDDADVPGDKAGLLALLAARFVAWAGPATIDDFAVWAGCGKRDAKAAITGLDVVPVAVSGYADVAWVRRDQLDVLKAAEPSHSTRLLPFEDNFVALHQGLGNVVDDAHHAIQVANWGRSGVTGLGKAKHIHRRTIVHEARVVGFWEWDADADEVVHWVFDDCAPDLAPEDAMVRDVIADLGHARSYSLDKDAAVAKRAAGLREERAS